MASLLQDFRSTPKRESVKKMKSKEAQARANGGWSRRCQVYYLRIVYCGRYDANSSLLPRPDFDAPHARKRKPVQPYASPQPNLLPYTTSCCEYFKESHLRRVRVAASLVEESSPKLLEMVAMWKSAWTGCCMVEVRVGQGVGQTCGTGGYPSAFVRRKPAVTGRHQLRSSRSRQRIQEKVLQRMEWTIGRDSIG